MSYEKPGAVEENWRDAISSIEEVIDDARNGRMFILVDHEDRENEGDLVIPAQMATPEAINFMATHGRGLICLTLTGERIEALGLPMMSAHNASRHDTPFTISIEAREGVTTGISAHDRARTVAVAIDAAKGAADIATPGHIFPLRAKAGGVLVRAGHTEAAVDVSRLAGLNPSGVICEIMNEDGTMARLPDLVAFAQRHALKIGTISDLIRYRRRHDHLVNEKRPKRCHLGLWRRLDHADFHRRNPRLGTYRADQGRHHQRRARAHPHACAEPATGHPWHRPHVIRPGKRHARHRPGGQGRRRAAARHQHETGKSR